ncbi:MAG TPA: precorrin-3B C(17)-methyltransferase [Kineosporiaceae bacterium]
MSAVGLVAATAAGRRQVERVAAAWPPARVVDAGSVAASLRTAWATCDAVVAFVAAGAVVRVLGPLLADKHTEPAVVVVDDAGRHAIALLGGHAAGANTLAADVAALLGGSPVVTTATDVAGVTPLDDLGWPVEGAVARVTRGMLDGDPVRWEAGAVWPLPAFPPNIRPDAVGPLRIVVTDVRLDVDGHTVVLRPPSLVVGVGASRGAPVGEVLALIDRALTDAGLSPASVRCLATAEVKAGEPGVVEAARVLGVPLVTHAAAALAAVPVPHPSEVVRRAVGTPSVAEAAAVLGDGGPTGELVVDKTASATATVAVARHAARGRLAIVGLGPGARDLMTPRAAAELRRASVVVGLDQYVEQVRDLLRPGTRVLVTGLGQEEERARTAVAEARAGQAVALIGSGDAGVYAMASPALEEADGTIDVVGVPGVTAGLAASAVLGAPLGHDHAYLSLSDLHTPWPVIERRLRAAAEGDLVVLLYNPRSRARHWQLGAALALLAEHRPPATPVGVVRNASRPDESVVLATLAEVDPGGVDMYSLVVVGSSQTRIVAGRMVTPRGYHWRAPGTAAAGSPEGPQEVQEVR